MATIKEYIGNGVYAEYTPYEVVLTTENGLEVTNRIVLEAEVLDRLNEFLKRQFLVNNLSRGNKNG